jgi:cytochrome c-type biogenesis protein CcsB
VSAHAYLLLTQAFYAVGLVQAILHVVTRRPLLGPATIAATLAGFALHTASLSLRWLEAGHFPALGLHDGASFLAWATVLVFLMTYLRTRLEAVGLAVFPAAFALVLVANLTRPGPGVPPAVAGLFLPLHAMLAFLGYAALFLASAIGVLYLIQEHELKSHSPRRFYYLVPSLERCDTLAARAVGVGFALLTLAIVTGLLWSHEARGRYWTGDAKEWSALLAWGLYILLLVARRRTGWGGRRAAWLGIAGFTAVVFTFVWMAIFPGMPGGQR